MVIDIKMCRFENVPWGFRLVGGADFDYPLTVVKVHEGSIADDAGLREGDIIVRVNDTATSPLSHDEADKTIRHCGNVFYLGVYREEEELENAPKHFPITTVERPHSPESFLDAASECKSPESVAQSDDYGNNDYLPELPERPSSVLSENTERKLVEEEIAAVLSGESEVLKEHNTLGIFPKPGVCMSSDVLRTLNEEAIKTKAEKDKENKKWTTFLQKPNRPIPKSQAQLEAERRAANAYKVKIVKSATKTPEPERPISPAAEVKVEPEPEPVPQKEPTPPEVEEPPPADSEVPNLEESDASRAGEEKEEVEENANGAEKSETADEGDEDAEQSDATVIVTNEQENGKETTPPNETVDESTNSPPPTIVQKTEEELALERQLVDVQRQLAALSSLPSTIQTTLDAVTKQLAELLPAFKLQQPQPQAVEMEARKVNLESIGEEASEEIKEGDKAVTNDGTEDTKHPDNEQQIENKHADMVERCADTTNAAQNDNDDREVESFDPAKRQEAQQCQGEMRQMEAEQNVKKQKRNDVMEELEEHLERKNNPKRSKRAFGPLTPSSERPLVLPGGRRWYRPKDAYNDEFIAETLSAQAELITGTTLGCNYESPLLGYDSRVNFMKYQKPERKIDLNRSEVYKVIHHLDRAPVRGIEVRPPVVPAEVDIRKAVH